MSAKNFVKYGSLSRLYFLLHNHKLTKYWLCSDPNQLERNVVLAREIIQILICFILPSFASNNLKTNQTQTGWRLEYYYEKYFILLIIFSMNQLKL